MSKTNEQVAADAAVECARKNGWQPEAAGNARQVNPGRADEFQVAVKLSDGRSTRARVVVENGVGTVVFWAGPEALTGPAEAFLPKA